MSDSRRTDDAPRPPAGGSPRWPAFTAALLLFLLILFWPTPAGLALPAQRLAAVTAVMAVLWVTQPVSVTVTSLIPLVAYPCLGILDSFEVSRAYSDRNVFLFLGGFLIAAAIERWGLHQRIALHVVSRLGGKPWQVVTGFMLATALLSMWISNSAATMLMTPIAMALLATLHKAIDPAQEDEDTARAIDRLAVPLLLGIAYAASCGGLTTIVGTPTNLSLRGYWEREFVSEGYSDLSVAEWMITFIPLGVVMLCFVGIVMYRSLPHFPQAQQLSRRFFAERLGALGRASGSEQRVLAVFAATALLWIFRKPLQFGDTPLLPDWPSLLARLWARFGWDGDFLPSMVDDSTIAIGMAVLLFLLPGDPQQGKRTPLLTWKHAERVMPWGMLLLIGSGFAMADAFKETELADWLGMQLADGLQQQPLWVLIIGVCLMVTFLTEFTTNVATVNALLPTLGAMAVQLNVDPRLLLIPATVTASCSFMFPVGTPPNAIVFGTGRVPILEMVRYGFLLNLFGVFAVTAITLLWGTWVMGIR